MRIQIQFWIRIQGFGSKNVKLYRIKKLQFVLSLSLHEVRPSYRKTSSTSKHEISELFLFLWVIFGLLDPDPPSLCGSVISRTQLLRIRIHNGYLKQLQIAYCNCIMHLEKYQFLETRESTYKALRLQNTLLLKK
jgi:hypothetical protein